MGSGHKTTIFGCRAFKAASNIVIRTDVLNVVKQDLKRYYARKHGRIAVGYGGIQVYYDISMHTVADDKSNIIYQCL